MLGNALKMGAKALGSQWKKVAIGLLSSALIALFWVYRSELQESARALMEVEYLSSEITQQEEHLQEFQEHHSLTLDTLNTLESRENAVRDTTQDVVQEARSADLGDDGNCRTGVNYVRLLNDRTDDTTGDDSSD